MNHDDFDDGLVHNHDWASTPFPSREMFPVADASGARTPSTVHHDEHLVIG